MAYKTFEEYLDHKNQLKTSGTVKKVADYDGPENMSTVAKNPNKAEKGFADEGDKKLIYTPDVETPAKVGEGGTKTATWPKTKTQEWLDQTKGLSLSEFTKNITKNINPTNLKSVHETVSNCKTDKKYVENLVREFKRTGLLKQLVAEMLQHKESFDVLAKLMEKDEQVSRRLVRSFNELAGLDLGLPAPKDKSEKFGKFNKFKKKPKFGEEFPEDDLEAPMDDELDPSMGDEGDLEDMPPEEGDDLDPSMDPSLDGEEPAEGDLDMPPEDGGDLDPSMGDDMDALSPPEGDMMPPPRKKKKKHPAHHLMNAMKGGPMSGMFGKPGPSM